MEFTKEENRMYLEMEGKVEAEITFPAINETLVDINHTYVSEKLRGQGIAPALVEAVVKELIEEHKTCIASCTYAQAWFKRHPEVAHKVLKQD